MLKSRKSSEVCSFLCVNPMATRESRVVVLLHFVINSTR